MTDTPDPTLPNPARRLLRFFMWFQQYDPNNTGVQRVLVEYFRDVEHDAAAEPIGSFCRALRLPAAAEACVHAAAGAEEASTLCQWTNSANSFFAGFALEMPAHHVASRLNNTHMDMLRACAVLVDVAGKGARDDASEVLASIFEFRQEVESAKLDETLRIFIMGALGEIERAVTDHCSGVPDQDRVIMATGYDAWRWKQGTRANSTARKTLVRLQEIMVGAFNCVVRANSSLALAEKIQKFLGD